MSGIAWAFWSAVGVILYTFFGYPLLLTVAARLRPRPHKQAPITPSVTILIPAYNEARVIEAKLENSLAQDYPQEKLDVLVVADGSDDDTAARAQRYARRGVRVLHEPVRRGKIAAVNRAMPWVKSEVVVFTDANAMLTENAVAALVRHFADPEVAAVAGEKRVAGGGEGLYWRYESYLKGLDSRLSSVMGAAGELFALRRHLFQPPPQDSIIEDFVLSMELVAAGWRVVYEPAAVAFEEGAPSLQADWRRRTRIAAGGFQAIARLRPLLHPRYGLVWWQYISHRVLRWAVTPFLLPAAFVLNWLLIAHPFYLMLALGQTLFYGTGLLGYRQAKQGRGGGLPYIVFFFCLTNVAALVGFWRYLTGNQAVTWEKVRE